MYEIFCLTETWLKPSVNSNELFNLNYFNVFRNDRLEKRGGGVLVAVSAIYRTELIDCSLIISACQDANVIGLLISKNTFSFIVLTIYIPPATTLESFSFIFNALNDLSVLYEYKLFVIGDFNVPSFYNNSITNDHDS